MEPTPLKNVEPQSCAEEGETPEGGGILLWLLRAFTQGERGQRAVVIGHSANSQVCSEVRDVGSLLLWGGGTRRLPHRTGRCSWTRCVRSQL